MARYEAAWLTRPIVLVLIALAIAVICYPLIQSRRSRVRHATRHA
jgi:TctA family transporter